MLLGFWAVTEREKRLPNRPVKTPKTAVGQPKGTARRATQVLGTVGLSGHPAAGAPGSRRFLGAGFGSAGNAGGGRCGRAAPHAAGSAAPPCRTVPYRTVPPAARPGKSRLPPSPSVPAVSRAGPTTPPHWRSPADNSKMEDAPSQPLINNVARCLPV